MKERGLRAREKKQEGGIERNVVLLGGTSLLTAPVRVTFSKLKRGPSLKY